MTKRHLVPGLLAACLFVPGPVLAQRVRQHDTDTLEPARRPAARSQSEAGPDLSRVQELIAAQTNEFRSKHDRKSLTVNAKLAETAQDFAHFMGRTDKYGHEADGHEPWERGKAHGYDYCLFAENIAWQYSSAGFDTEELARRFMTAWEHSPEHRRNLLDPGLTAIGVGVAHSKETGRYYAVQDFGRPRSQAISFRIANDAGRAVRYQVGDKSYTLEPNYTRTHTLCRPSSLKFPKIASGTDKEGQSFAIKKGERFVVRTGKEGGLVVHKQEAP